MLANLIGAVPIILALILLESFLSVDNALVLATMVEHLPTKAKAKRVRNLRLFGRTFTLDEYNPQKVALRAGLLGAYIMRGGLMLAAAWLIANPWIKLVAAAYLLYLMCSNLGVTGDGDDDGGARLHGHTLLMTIVSVEIADLMFSTDNIMGAVAYSQKLWAVIVGVFIGILAMRFVAGFFVKLIEKLPVLANVAYVLIGSIGIQLLISGVFHVELSEFLKFVLVLAICAAGIAYERVPALNRALSPLFHGAAVVMGKAALVVQAILTPVKFVGSAAASGLRNSRSS